MKARADVCVYVYMQCFDDEAAQAPRQSISFDDILEIHAYPQECAARVDSMVEVPR